MLFEIMYRRKDYCLADALRPDPFYGKRIYRANTDDLGTTDEAELEKAARQTAPEGYEFYRLTMFRPAPAESNNAA